MKSTTRYKKGLGDVVENVVEKEGEIIALIQKNPKISARQMGQHLDVTERTIQRYLQNLIQEKKLKRQGPARGSKWILMNE